MKTQVKGKAIVSKFGRQPIIPQRGSGLGGTNVPVANAKHIVGLRQRKKS